MGRLFVLLLCVGVLVCGTQVSAQPLPKLAPKLVIAVFQKLDDSNKITPLLNRLEQAYTKRTSESAIPSATVKQKLGDYGAKIFGKCKLKSSCLSKKMRIHFPITRYGLFLGVGGLGDAVLLNMILIDLKTGKEIKRLNQSFNDKADIATKLPLVMKQLFPGYASIRWQGLPEGSTATINGRQHRNPKQWVGVPANQGLQIVLSAPGYTKEVKQVQLTANSQITQIVKLKPAKRKPPKRIKKRRDPPPPPKSGSVTKKWWFWTIIGVAAAAGAGVGIGLAVQNGQRKEGKFIPVDIPPI